MKKLSMGVINIRKIPVFIAIVFLVLSSCKTKTEIIRLELKSNNSKFVVKYYMINNPPDQSEEILSVINKSLDTILSQDKAINRDVNYYLVEYYRERLFFDRHYKPHYKWYNPYIYDDIRDGQSHLKDRWVTVILKSERDSCDACPIMPIYILHKKGLKYYPNGFRNDPDKHWENMKD